MVEDEYDVFVVVDDGAVEVVLDEFGEAVWVVTSTVLAGLADVDDDVVGITVSVGEVLSVAWLVEETVVSVMTESCEVTASCVVSTTAVLTTGTPSIVDVYVEVYT